MTTQWGAPLTGAQMKLLRAAGLPEGSPHEFYVDGNGSWVHDFIDHNGFVEGHRQYRLPADHPAYTLLNAGWLDGRAFRLHYGSDRATNDWPYSTPVLLRDGTVTCHAGGSLWAKGIIAYTRKAEGLTTHADRVLADAERMARRMGGKFVKNELWGDVVAASGEAAKADSCAGGFEGQPETVTIAKMTEAEAMQRFGLPDDALSADFDAGSWAILRQLGLIKPEQTRLERFWATRDTKDVYGPPCKAFQLIEEALNFERD